MGKAEPVGGHLTDGPSCWNCAFGNRLSQSGRVVCGLRGFQHRRLMWPDQSCNDHEASGDPPSQG
jgi:hypothetical protein